MNRREKIDSFSVVNQSHSPSHASDMSHRDSALLASSPPTSAVHQMAPTVAADPSPVSIMASNN